MRQKRCHFMMTLPSSLWRAQFEKLTFHIRAIHNIKHSFPVPADDPDEPFRTDPEHRSQATLFLPANDHRTAMALTKVKLRQTRPGVKCIFYFLYIWF